MWDCWKKAGWLINWMSMPFKKWQKSRARSSQQTWLGNNNVRHTSGTSTEQSPCGRLLYKSTGLFEKQLAIHSLTPLASASSLSCLLHKPEAHIHFFHFFLHGLTLILFFNLNYRVLVAFFCFIMKMLLLTVFERRREIFCIPQWQMANYKSVISLEESVTLHRAQTRYISIVTCFHPQGSSTPLQCHMSWHTCLVRTCSLCAQWRMFRAAAEMLYMSWDKQTIKHRTQLCKPRGQSHF